MELADRRAFFSAHREMLRSLLLVAQSLDALIPDGQHVVALDRGLTALEEAEQIARYCAPIRDDERRLAQFVSTHRTPLSFQSSPNVGVALQHYYTYAQEQLALAMGTTREGADALSALGKLYANLQDAPQLIVDPIAKAFVCQQAALLVVPRHWRAANELGVLLAASSRNAEALRWLKASASWSPQAAAWHNLAHVYRRLGHVRLARDAARRAEQLGGGQSLAKHPPVKVQPLSAMQTPTDAIR